MRVLPSPGHGDWFRHMIKPGQSEPLDLTVMWVNTFPFFFLKTICASSACKWKSSDKYNMNKENYSTELSSFSLLQLFPSLPIILHFFPSPSNAFRIVEYLNLALSTYDITMRQKVNLSLAPSKLYCDSISWYLDIKVESSFTGWNRTRLNRPPIQMQYHFFHEVKWLYVCEGE